MCEKNITLLAPDFTRHAYVYKQRFLISHTEFYPYRNMKVESTGLFISLSGISELDCAATKTDTAERSISIGRESLQVFFCTRGLGVLPGSTDRG